VLQFSQSETVNKQVFRMRQNAEWESVFRM